MGAFLDAAPSSPQQRACFHRSDQDSLRLHSCPLSRWPSGGNACASCGVLLHFSHDTEERTLCDIFAHWYLLFCTIVVQRFCPVFSSIFCHFWGHFYIFKCKALTSIYVLNVFHVCVVCPLVTHANFWWIFMVSFSKVFQVVSLWLVHLYSKKLFFILKQFMSMIFPSILLSVTRQELTVCGMTYWSNLFSIG